eukprot:1743763-Alexandrium_andersonii.AAC.1
MGRLRDPRLRRSRLLELGSGPEVRLLVMGWTCRELRISWTARTGAMAGAGKPLFGADGPHLRGRRRLRCWSL